MQRSDVNTSGSGRSRTSQETGHHMGSSELAARLSASGRMLGVNVTVTEDEEWHAVGGSEPSVRIGLGFYQSRGHGEAEAVALALLEVWSTLRLARVMPERVRRARAIARLRPELVPLVAAVERLLAGGELLTVMPGFRPALAAAIHREIPRDLSEWPRHLQWVGALQLQGLAPTEPSYVDGAVKAELEALRPETLRRLMQPRVRRPALDQFERALGALVPQYLRLLEIDVQSVGLATSGSAPTDDESGEQLDDESLSAGQTGGEGEESAGESGETESEPPQDDAEAARSGEGRESAEGSDLFAAEQAAFVREILPTPMPTQGALIDAILDDLSDMEASNSSDTTESAATVGHGATTATGLGAYRARADSLESFIVRMRNVWQMVVSERVSRRPQFSRVAMSEGEMLDADSLARTVSEVHAGVTRPRAFRRRLPAAKTAENPGATDYVLLIDRSGSMQGRAAEQAADAVIIMLEALAGAARDIAHTEQQLGIELDLGIRTSLIVFDAEAVVLKPLAAALDDESRLRLDAVIRSPGGATNDGAALRAAAEQLGIVRGAESHLASNVDGVSRKRVVIFVSDGGSNDPVHAAAWLSRLRSAGVSVWGIGLGSIDVERRFAPTSVQLDDPARLAAEIQGIIEREAPRYGLSS